MSKRGMEMQGGADRYGGDDGRETPSEPPARATAAQMARRKIASIKGARSSRSTSPTKAGPSPSPGGGFGQLNVQQPSQPPQQSGFSFAQQAPQQAQAPAQNGFTFGQSQPSSNGGFSFGQPQAAAPSAFTFGGQSQAPSQNGGFSFGGQTTSAFPQSNGTKNPFAAQDTHSETGKTAFSGSVFSIPGTPTPSTSEPTKPATNGLGSKQLPQLSDEQKQEIGLTAQLMDREQQHELADVIRQNSVELRDKGDNEMPALEELPSQVQYRMYEYIQRWNKEAKSKAAASNGFSAAAQDEPALDDSANRSNTQVRNADSSSLSNSSKRRTTVSRSPFAWTSPKERLHQSVRQSASPGTPSSTGNEASAHAVASFDPESSALQQSSLLQHGNFPTTPLKQQSSVDLDAFAESGAGTLTPQDLLVLDHHNIRTPELLASFVGELKQKNITSFDQLCATIADEQQQQATPTPTPTFSFGTTSTTPKAAEASKQTNGFSFSSPQAKAPSSASNIFSSPTPEPQKPAEPRASATPAASSTFGGFAASTPPSKPASNPFASLQRTPPQYDPSVQQKTPAPAFTFDQPKESTPAKSNPFASLARTPSQQSQQSTQQQSTSTAGSMFDRVEKPGQNGDSANGVAAETGKIPDFGFTFTSAPSKDATTPARPASVNIFNSAADSSRSPEKATQGGPPTFSSQPPTQSSKFAGFSTSSPQSSNKAPTLAAEKSAGTTFAGQQGTTVDVARKLRDLNEALMQHLASSAVDGDWSSTLHYYLERRVKLTSASSSASQQVHPVSAAPSASKQPAANGGSAQAPKGPAPNHSFGVVAPLAPSTTNNKRKVDEHEQETAIPRSPEKRSRAIAEASPAKAPTFSFSSPQKPLSETATIFDQILQSPDHRQPSTTPNQPAGMAKQASNMSGQIPPTNLVKPSPSSEPPGGVQTQQYIGSTPDVANPFKPAAPANTAPPAFQVPKFGSINSSGSPALSSAPSFSLPKFGSGSSGTTNFLSSFGANAEKEAARLKAKRKAEEFDSDEDDEEEWERQDRERQEAKKQKLGESTKKTLKQVNGQFIFMEEAVSPAPEPAASAPSAPPPPTLSGSNTASVFSSQIGSQPAAPSNPFAHLSGQNSAAGTAKAQEGAEDEEEDEEEDEDAYAAARTPKNATFTMPSTTPAASPAKSGGMFDRVSTDANGDLGGTQVSKPPTTPGFKFGGSVLGGQSGASSTFSGFKSSTSPAGDNTWKPESPIRFAGNDTDGSTTPTGSPAKPAFSFGGPASTPKSSFGQPAAPLPSSGNGEIQPAGPPKFNFSTTAGQPTATPKFNFGGPPTSTTKDSSDRPFAGLFGGDKSAAPAISEQPKAAPANPFAHLNASSTDKAGSSVGFQFGGPANGSSLFPPGASTAAPSVLSSAAGSRASTPGLTTDGEADDADAAPPEPQRDLTALSAEEQRTETVLFEGKARARRFNRDVAGNWENKGVGIIRLLRNNESGTVRVLMRLMPGGAIVLNSNVMRRREVYGMMGDKGVKMVFAEDGGALATFNISFGRAESANELFEQTVDAIDAAGEE